MIVRYRHKRFDVEALGDGRSRWRDSTDDDNYWHRSEPHWATCPSMLIALLEIGAYCADVANEGKAIAGFSVQGEVA